MMPEPARAATLPRRHYGSLDGIRGLCALWVLLGHLLNSTGEHWAIWAPLEHPLLSVDVFMVLSGFLMVTHFEERRSIEPWAAPATWCRFWLRRGFRIAPLYYTVVLLMIVFRNRFNAVWDPAWPSLDYATVSLATVVNHLSFAFGLLPGSYRSLPVPDWSLSLEMQFYVVFPGLMLLWARMGAAVAAIVLSATCLVLAWMLPDYFAAFVLPSALPAKLPIFLAGMLIATWAGRPQRTILLPALAVLLAFVPTPGAGGAPSLVSRAILVALVAALVGTELGIARPLAGTVALLRSRLLRFMGDASYGVYLVHFPLLILLSAAVTRLWPQADGGLRSLLLLLPLLLSSYAVAWMLHVGIERPGIELGRAVLARARSVRARYRPETVGRAS